MGRTPIFELLPVDTQVREKLVTGFKEAELRAMAREKGYGGLLDSAVSKLMSGVTTAEEVISTTFTDL